MFDRVMLPLKTVCWCTTGVFVGSVVPGCLLAFCMLLESDLHRTTIEMEERLEVAEGIKDLRKEYMGANARVFKFSQTFQRCLVIFTIFLVVLLISCPLHSIIWTYLFALTFVALFLISCILNLPSLPKVRLLLSIDHDDMDREDLLFLKSCVHAVTLFGVPVIESPMSSFLTVFVAMPAFIKIGLLKKY